MIGMLGVLANGAPPDPLSVLLTDLAGSAGGTAVAILLLARFVWSKLTVIETKLDTEIAALRTADNGHDTRLTDHERRLSEIEGWARYGGFRTQIPGAPHPASQSQVSAPIQLSAGG